VIIGGGFAGLAAGVELSERGYEVELLERRNRLGGRAYSFIDARTGDIVDNGQHLFMRCYRATVAFLKKINRLDRLHFQDRLRVEFLDRENGFITFECADTFAPLHILAGLFRMKGLTAGDKLRALKLGNAIRSKNGHEQLTVSKWLARLSQSENISERFWNPLAIATLNESPDTASAKMLAVVLREAFTGTRDDSCIGISKVGLSDLYTDGAQDYIEARSGRVQINAQVSNLVIENGRVAAVELKNGDRVEADYFISAVPHAAFLDILPDEMRRTEFASVEKLDSSPILSINLWFDRPVIDRDFVGMIGTKVQWIFNKDLIVRGSKSSNHLALIISAARGFVDMTKDDLVEMALKELREMIPASRPAQLLHSQIVKEREATLSHTVESDSIRPGASTSLPNFILAGDWTDTGLPATIESAVLSGNVAAELITRKG
jgi:squalene-associated FAD-dependent desaturase